MSSDDDEQFVVTDDEQFILTDAERNSALATLVRACGAGQLTLEDFSRRTDVAFETRSRADLVAVTSDLGPPLTPPGRLKRRWFVPFGNRIRHGRFELPERTSMVVLMGEIHLDLRGATLVGPEPTIKLWVLAGNLRILVPRGIQVDVDSSSLFGGRAISTFGSPRPGAPVLRVRMIDLMGNVKVTDDPTMWSPVVTAMPSTLPPGSTLAGPPAAAGLQSGTPAPPPPPPPPPPRVSSAPLPTPPASNAEPPPAAADVPPPAPTTSD